MISIIFLLTLLPIIACADAVEIDGIWYNIIGKGKANVTYNPSGEKYTDEVIIPEKIIIGDDEYKVIGISSNAFEKCSGLSSIKIGDNVNYIGQEADNIKVIKVDMSANSPFAFFSNRQVILDS